MTCLRSKGRQEQSEDPNPFQGFFPHHTTYLHKDREDNQSLVPEPLTGTRVCAHKTRI